MTTSVKHSKVSSVPDGDDTSLVRPSDWNADHTFANQSANTVLLKQPELPVKVRGTGTGVRTITTDVLASYPRKTQKTIPTTTTYPKVP